MLQTESILKLYTLDHYVVLVTAKRIICVEDLGSEKQIQRDEVTTSRAGSTTNMYKHWNVYFDDILKIKEMKIQKPGSHPEHSSWIYVMRVLYS